MIVQYTNDTLALVSSQTQLRILSHRKFQEEYLKLWESKDKSRSQIIEKWEKIYEIHFNQAGTSVKDATNLEEEHLVNFEIISSNLIDGGNGFQINLVIFTSFNQYLVFETQTTLLENLKTLSQTKLLYHVYTTDCPVNLLGSINFQSEWSTSRGSEANNRTVIALMTEVNQSRQRKELLKKEEVTVLQSKNVASNPMFDDFGEDEEDNGNSDEDDDIFAQFTKPAKKQEPLLKKAKQEAAAVSQPEPVVPEVPLKPMVIVKMIQFDDETSKQKQCKELWKIELPVDFKRRMVKCRTSEQFFAFMTREPGNKEDQLVVYLYDIMQNKYLGYINLNSLICSATPLETN